MFGADVDTTWEVGSPITWSGEHEGTAYQDKGEVLDFDPPSRLSVSHYSPMGGKPDVPANYHRLEYTIAEAADGSMVTLEQDGNDSEEQAEQFAQNWQMSWSSSSSTSRAEPAGQPRSTFSIGRPLASSSTSLSR
jgi:hypothetical protein